ncbi:L-lactate permease, partial [Mycobacterium numidiamassiliense]
VLALVANTAPVAFGAMATPIITLAQVSGLSTETLGAMVGRQTPIMSAFVPLALVAIVDGRRGMRETWPIAPTGGVVFGLGQYATSNFVSVPLADVIASLLSALAIVLLVRARRTRAETQPAEIPAEAEPGETSTDRRASVLRAHAPYGIVIAVFVVCQISVVKKLLETATFAVRWPGLNLYTAKGTVSALPKFTLNLLTTPGSDTSANSLFGALQVAAATKAGLSPVLMAASNSSGGVLGKMISPQNLAIGAAAVEFRGKEGDLFRRVVVWSLVFLAFICALSGLQAYVLSWMVP